MISKICTERALVFLYQSTMGDKIPCDSREKRYKNSEKNIVYSCMSMEREEPVSP